MKKLFLPFILIFTMAVSAKTYLFIGDSITDGNRGSPQGYPCSSEERNKTDLNHVLGHGYVEMIAGEMMGENPDIGCWIWDGIHPTTAMHYRMSREWIKTSNPVLKIKK